MTVDTFVSIYWLTHPGLNGAPTLAISIDARPTREIEHQYVVLPGGGGLPGWSTVMRTKRPLI